MSDASDARAEREREVRAALESGDDRAAVTRTIELYGAELFRFVRAGSRSDAAAEDAYQDLCVELLRALPGFGWRASLRTWLYRLARGALSRQARDPRRREARLSTGEQSALLASWTRTATHEWRRTESKDRLWAACDELAPDDRALVVLRLKDRMSWRDVARVLGDDENAESDALEPEAARLRKRFERIKSGLRDRLAG